MKVCGKTDIYIPPCKSPCNLIDLEVTDNGTYRPEFGVDGFSSVDVDVSPEIGPEDEGKVVQEGRLITQTTIYIASNGTHDTTANNSAIVNVPNSYTQSDEGKVVSNGALVAQTGRTVTANDTYDTTTNNSVAVNVPSYPEPTGTVSITSNGTQNVKDYASANVNVPNTYTASDEYKVVHNGALEAQTSRSITANGSYDTSLNNDVSVNVPNSYTASDEGKVVSNGALVGQTSTSVTENGTYITTLYSQVTVNVPTGGEQMVILSYGNSTWDEFIAAYQTNSIVYARASSNSNPASGSQTRLAFMAYVNNAANPTEVEFQYYRSVSSHSATQQGDQVYVYKLQKTAGWTVQIRESYTKIAVGSGLTSSYSNGTLTISLA